MAQIVPLNSFNEIRDVWIFSETKNDFAQEKNPISFTLQILLRKNVQIISNLRFKI